MVRYDKKILAIGMALIGLTILGIIGLTYAYFTAGVIGNENADNTVIETADLRLVFNDTELITLNNALPGVSTSKTFTVENIGNADITYDIELVDVTNTFSNDELIYKITSDNSGGTISNAVVPSIDGVLINNVTVDAGVTQTYTMTVKFIETGSSQNDNQGASFSGKLQIVPRIQGVALAGYVYDENDDPMSGATVEVHSDPVSTITDETGYYEISDILVGVHTIYIKDGETTLGSKEVTLVSSDTSVLQGTNTLKLPKEANKYINLKLDSGLININLSEIPKTIKEQILSNNTAQSDASIDFTQSSSETNGRGLYYTEDASTYGEDGEKIYYFRGNVDNNWVSFGGYLWRIVRTTSEGGVKLVYSGDGNSESSAFINTSLPFNTVSEPKYYVGYTYNTDLNGYTGEQTNSAIKNVIDTWYDENLSSYASYLSDTAIYCNDRSSERIDGGSIYYPAYDRLLINKRPTYACPSENASRYTVSTETGNGYLQKPIALLTIDEIYYAGLILGVGSLDSYIMENTTGISYWWTMSPFNWGGVARARATAIYSQGFLGGNIIYILSGSRSSVSLKSSVMYAGGTGSKENPYQVE